jgi:UDP-GlcNAc3NAcA epimerase
MNIVHVVGNRPQFIKLALLYPELRRRAGGNGDGGGGGGNGGSSGGDGQGGGGSRSGGRSPGRETGGSGGRSRIIHTGQHFDPEMSDIFFRQLGIPTPDHQLSIHSLSHNEMIGNMLIGIDRLFAAERPDLVVVYGDTNTTLAGALAAKKRNIPLAHIESGIRTGKEDMPEESNRYLTDRVADWNFACTYLGVENLVREGYGGGGAGTGAIRGGVYNSGDLMLDAALLFKDQALGQSVVLRDRKLGDKPFILATIHRAENTDNTDSLRNVITALNTLHRHTPVLFPMHPRTGQLIAKLGLKVDFTTTGPLGYLDMLALVQSCHSVLTDSGGLSREAFFFQKPALVVMQNPFWPEIFAHGNCLRADATVEDIAVRQQELLAGSRAFGRDVFGDGRAAVKISKVLTGEVSGNG